MIVMAAVAGMAGGCADENALIYLFKYVPLYAAGASSPPLL